jgi:uncharacterized Zn finger protein
MPRETVEAKAARLLVDGRVRVLSVSEHRIDASVAGDHDRYRVRLTTHRRLCSCPSWRGCSHLAAVERVVDSVAPGEAEGRFSRSREQKSKRGTPLETVAGLGMAGVTKGD